MKKKQKKELWENPEEIKIMLKEFEEYKKSKKYSSEYNNKKDLISAIRKKFEKWKNEPDSNKYYNDIIKVIEEKLGRLRGDDKKVKKRKAFKFIKDLMEKNRDKRTALPNPPQYFGQVRASVILFALKPNSFVSINNGIKNVLNEFLTKENKLKPSSPFNTKDFLINMEILNEIRKNSNFSDPIDFDIFLWWLYEKRRNLINNPHKGGEMSKNVIKRVEKRYHCLAKIAWSEEKWQGFNKNDADYAEDGKYGEIGFVKKSKFAHDWFTFYPDLHEIDDKFEKGYYYGYVQASGRGEDREHHPEEHGFINGCSLIFFLSTKENKRFIVGVYGKAEFLRNNRKSISMEKLKGFPFNETNVGKKGIKNVEFNIRGAKEYSVVFDKFIPVEEIEKSLNIKIDMRSAMTSYKFGEVEFDDNIASKILCIAREKSEDEKVKETINKILNLIHGICLSAFLPQDYLKDLLVSVLAKPFVILAGITGTGKSLVAKEFAKAICAKHILIPVRPDWTDSSGLLGYKNVFTNQWVSTPFLEFILAADKDKDTPYVAILDEMNLARVEYYFSDFLSVLEDKERRTSGMNIEKLPMAVSYSEHSDNYWKKKWLEELKQEGKLYKKRGCSKSKRRFY